VHKIYFWNTLSVDTLTHWVHGSPRWPIQRSIHHCDTTTKWVHLKRGQNGPRGHSTIWTNPSREDHMTLVMFFRRNARSVPLDAPCVHNRYLWMHIWKMGLTQTRKKKIKKISFVLENKRIFFIFLNMAPNECSGSKKSQIGKAKRRRFGVSEINLLYF
jgi:hypothetical protein